MAQDKVKEALVSQEAALIADIVRLDREHGKQWLAIAIRAEEHVGACVKAGEKREIVTDRIKQALRNGGSDFNVSRLLALAGLAQVFGQETIGKLTHTAGFMLQKLIERKPDGSWIAKEEYKRKAARIVRECADGKLSLSKIEEKLKAEGVSGTRGRKGTSGTEGSSGAGSTSGATDSTGKGGANLPAVDTSNPDEVGTIALDYLRGTEGSFRAIGRTITGEQVAELVAGMIDTVRKTRDTRAFDKLVKAVEAGAKVASEVAGASRKVG